MVLVGLENHSDRLGSHTLEVPSPICCAIGRIHEPISVDARGIEAAADWALAQRAFAATPIA